jgi:hypothetical protein
LPVAVLVEPRRNEEVIDVVGQLGSSIARESLVEMLRRPLSEPRIALPTDSVTLLIFVLLFVSISKNEFLNT